MYGFAWCECGSVWVFGRRVGVMGVVLMWYVGFCGFVCGFVWCVDVGVLCVVGCVCV